VAQTKKKRRKKHKGTQGGRIDTTRRTRPRNRQEAKAQARSRNSGSAQRGNKPPTWRGSAIRGLAAAAIFFVVLLILFKRPVGAAAALGAFMLVFYIPAGYYIDTMMWRKRERAQMRSRDKS
jgi:Flp pilus assembly protein TadB